MVLTKNLITNDETVHFYALVLSSHELGAGGNLGQCMEFAWQCFWGEVGATVVPSVSF